MSKGVKLLAALMEDEVGSGHDLMRAARTLTGAVSDLLKAVEPTSGEVRAKDVLQIISISYFDGLCCTFSVNPKVFFFLSKHCMQMYAISVWFCLEIHKNKYIYVIFSSFLW